MNIVAIATVYNDLKFLKYKVQWAKMSGVNLYIIDNMSTDGTIEYLESENIPHHRFDTSGSFDLIALQSEIVKTLHIIKPDWFIYHGADLFFFTPYGIKYDIYRADADGHTSLSLRYLEVRNTGEESTPDSNPLMTYYYAHRGMKLRMVSKYHGDIELKGDNIYDTSSKFIEGGCIVNWGMSKSKEEREETFARRVKAWKSGLPTKMGSHYKEARRMNWIWNKESLIDLRDSEWSYILDNISKISNI